MNDANVQREKAKVISEDAYGYQYMRGDAWRGAAVRACSRGRGIMPRNEHKIHARPSSIPWMSAAARTCEDATIWDRSDGVAVGTSN